mmetsp:Transcript_11612/g.36020  ORF Transcript_11612/g.36020 Transcript_11612/m.36020 type:complete len:101 (-) Transcript_11612:550-852(-)|eukprot:scaffold295165_cov36-Tisochrysis_lutea.AAC.2
MFPESTVCTIRRHPFVPNGVDSQDKNNPSIPHLLKQTYRWDAFVDQKLWSSSWYMSGAVGLHVRTGGWYAGSRATVSANGSGLTNRSDPSVMPPVTPMKT